MVETCKPVFLASPLYHKASWCQVLPLYLWVLSAESAATGSQGPWEQKHGRWDHSWAAHSGAAVSPCQYPKV